MRKNLKEHTMDMIQILDEVKKTERRLKELKETPEYKNAIGAFRTAYHRGMIDQYPCKNNDYSLPTKITVGDKLVNFEDYLKNA